jgi:N6-adenosine-specific RNA methylase IME4
MLVRPTVDDIAELAAPEPFGGLRRAYYGCIVIDWPSRFVGRTALQTQNWKSSRSNERHYKTETVEKLAVLPVKALVAPTGCHLLAWTSGPFLKQALALIEGYDFKYSTRFATWVKLKRSVDPNQLRLVPYGDADLHIGLGLTVRHQTEMVLLARRGNCRRISKSVREVIFAPVREHSRKPDEFYRRVEQYCAGPYLELFAREHRPGWDSWGDEVDKFQ